MVISLIYFNRFIKINEQMICPSSWRPIYLTCLIVSKKVADDKNVENQQFSYIYNFFQTEEIDILEQIFLDIM